MAFKKYSTAQLDLVGEDLPNWVEEEETNKDKKEATASKEDSNKKDK